MADHPNQRLYRSPDGYQNVSSGTPVPAANDPLAELARLIGNDSFSDRHAGRQSASPALQGWDNGQAGHDAYADHAPSPNGYLDDQYQHAQPESQGGYGQPYDQQNFAEPQIPNGGCPAYSDDAQFAPQSHGQQYGQPAYSDQYHPEPQHYADQQQPLRQPPPFLGQQSFPPAGYAQDAQAQDDYYDDGVAKRRRAVLMAGAAAVLIVVGTAGAFGYRALFGSTSSGPPPVIKADATPTKIVSASPRDTSGGKSIQDRIGDQINEKLVSREEQPGDVKPQPRVVFPGPTANGAGTPSQPTAAGTSEPKKIRTVAIRPDGPDTGPAPKSPPAPARTASVAPVPMPTPMASPAPAPTQAAPAAPVRQVTPAPSSNGPLSLSPDAAPAPAVPARQVPRPAPQPQMASASAPGAYVQVSSQRSEGDAQSSFRALQAKYPAVLAGRSANIQRADLGDKGTYYRAMIGPLGSTEAVELCGSLKAAGGSCVIQKN